MDTPEIEEKKAEMKARQLEKARQLVSHGLIAVDGKKLSIPSARVRPGQESSFTDRGKKSSFYAIV